MKRVRIREEWLHESIMICAAEMLDAAQNGRQLCVMDIEDLGWLWAGASRYSLILHRKALKRQSARDARKNQANPQD